MVRLLVGCVLLFGLSGCALFQGQLSIDQAVARLVPNDPSFEPNPDRYIGEAEIMAATQLWIKGQPVPGTGGQLISEGAMKQLIVLWRSQALVP